MLVVDRGIARIPLPTSPIRASHGGSHGSGASSGWNGICAMRGLVDDPADQIDG